MGGRAGAVDGAVRGYLAGRMDGVARFPWLGRNPSGEAAYYLAIERGVRALPLPSTGLVEGTNP